MRHWIIFRDGIVDAEEKAWELQTCRIEIDAFSLCCSFVIAQVARSADEQMETRCEKTFETSHRVD